MDNTALCDLLSIFQEYHELLQDLSAETVEALFDSNFTENIGLDELSEAIDQRGGGVNGSPEFLLLFQRGTESCRKYLDTCNDCSLWVKLRENDICHRRLMVLLFHVIEVGLKRDSGFQARQQSVGAVQLYLSLCSISGSHTYNVYNSIIYQKCLDVLRMCIGQLLSDIEEKSSRTNKVSSRGRRGLRGRTAGSRASNRTGANDDSEYETVQELDADHLDAVRESTAELLCSLYRFLRALSLKEDRETVAVTASLLTESLLIDVGRGHVSLVRRLEDKTITEQGFACLQVLASSRHDRASRTVLKCLMPKLLLLPRNGVAPEKIAVETAKVRDLVVEFVSQLIQEADNAEMFSTIYIVCQHMALKIPDKADYRHRIGQTIADLLLKCPPVTTEAFVDWMGKLEKNPKGSIRGFAVDLALLLIRTLKGAHFDGLRFKLLRIIVDRSSDRAPTVRYRSLSTMATVLSQECHGFSLENFVPGRDEFERADDGEDRMETDASEEQTERDVETFLTLLTRRSEDERPLVRKAAIQAMGSSLSVIGRAEQRLKVFAALASGCADVSLSVRKQAADSLGKLLLAHPEDLRLQQYWLDGIMPLIGDRESSAQDKAAELIELTLFKNLRSRADVHRDLAWSLLVKIEKVNALSRYFSRAMIRVVRSGVVNPNILPVIESETRDPTRSAAAWMILADFSSVYNVSPGSALAAWFTIGNMADSALSYMGKIFSATAKKLKREDALELITDMQKKLDEFQLFPENISSIMHAAVRLIQVTADSEEDFAEKRRSWCKELFAECETPLSQLVFGEYGEVVEEEILRRLFTLGEIIQYCPELISKRIILIVEALVASEQLQHQLSLHSSGTGVLGMKAKIPRSIHTVAIVTLGKMCLLEEEVAKNCVPSLVRELSNSKDPQVRNNIMMTLADLCIRYTSLIDRHIGTLSLSLKDPAMIVRKQTLTLLTNLLKEDFLRWRGVLLYRFVSTLLDENEEIKKLADFCLVHVLLVRFPSMFSHHFLECLYFFNGVRHPSWESKEAAGDDSSVDGALFSLKGKRFREDRMKLYKFMLKQLADQDKFTVAAKISADIIGSAVDGVIPIHEETAELLHDCLMVLASEEIKISLHKNQNQQDDLEELDPALVAMEALKTKTVSQVVKRATMERIVPNVMSLKMILEKKRSWLMKPLLLYLRELMRDYRSEINEVLAGNKQVILEIEFDLKRLEAREAAANAPKHNPPADVVPPAEEGAREEEIEVPDRPRTPPPVPVQTPNSECPATPQHMIVESSPAPQREGSPKTPQSALGTPKTVNRRTPAIVLSSPSSPALSVHKQTASVRGAATPHRGQCSGEEVPARAISTPAHASRLDSELTFQLGTDFSVVPSPISHSHNEY